MKEADKAQTVLESELSQWREKAKALESDLNDARQEQAAEKKRIES